MSIEAKLAGLQLGEKPYVVDYGCGGQPYRDLLPRGCVYRGADLPDNPKADLTIGEGGRIPLPDGCCDLVLSTQVLEHVEDPAGYLLECHRVLKPGGKLLLTTHGLMFFHPYPHDLWRWTADGLKLMVERSGMQVTSVEGAVGLIPTAIWLVMFEYHTAIPWGLRHLFVLLCNWLMWLSDSMTTDAGRLRNACIYNVVAVRPANAYEPATP